MKKAKILLPILKDNGPVHLTDGRWVNPIRDDLPQPVLSGILEACGFQPDLWKEGYYSRYYNAVNIRDGLEKVTSYYAVSEEKREERWIWEINDKGLQLLEWFQGK